MLTLKDLRGSEQRLMARLHTARVRLADMEASPDRRILGHEWCVVVGQIDSLKDQLRKVQRELEDVLDAQEIARVGGTGGAL